MRFFPESLKTISKICLFAFLAVGCLLETSPNQAQASSQPYISGHGINFATGNKYLQETDIAVEGLAPSLVFKRTYNSQSTENGLLGYGWSGSFTEKLTNITATTITLVRNDGRYVQFNANGQGGYASQLGPVQTVTRTTTGFQLIQSKQDIHIYDSQGRLTSITYRNGTSLTYTYTNNQVASIIDSLGRTLAFTYTNGKLTGITTPAGFFAYSYDSNNNLTVVTRPDGKSRTYIYGNTAKVHNLTGVVDESGTRIQTLTYDSSGRVVTSALAGGLESVTIAYPSTMTRTVTDSLGVATTYQLVVLNGVARVKSFTGPGCSSCGSDSGSSYNYNSRQQISSVTDAEGTVTNYTYDTNGNRITKTRAAGTSLAQTTTSTYTMKNELATITEPSVSNPGQNRVTAMTYDENGNLLTRTVSGFSGNTPISGTTTFTYDALGRITSVDGPRTDVGDTMTLTYYPNEESQGPNRGQLHTVTNPLNQTTTYSDYTLLGKPGTFIDANGLTSRFTYNLRGQLLTRTTGSLTTSFTHDAAGRLQTVTTPGAGAFTYSYAGDKVATITDTMGNSIRYTYDAKGQRTGQEVYDPDQALTSSLGFAYDASGRITKTIYPGNAEETYAYDAVGNLITAIDPTGMQTDTTYDGLNRLLSVTEAGTAVATSTYDGHDNRTEVTDANGKITSFTYDDLRNRLITMAPDTGLTAATYDTTGNLLTLTDARNQTIAFGYDALNRPIRQSYPGAARDILFTYNAIGKLSAIQEEEGSRTFAYTTLGQLTVETKTLGSTTTTVGYRYNNTTGELASMTYPSGRVLSFSRDTTGRITDLQIDGTPLVSNVQYLPFGPVKSASLGSLTLIRSYDPRYQVNSIQVGGLDYTYTRDQAGQVTGVSNLPSPTTTGITETATYNPDNNRLTGISGGATRTYTYDANGNITSDGISTYSYDALNRLIKVEKSGGILATFGYDSQNRRIRKTIHYHNNKNPHVHKTVGTKTISYHYSRDNLLISETLANGNPLRDYFYLNGEPIAMREYEENPGLYYFINDHLGTPQQLVTSTGTIVWQAAYLPFGQAQIKTATVTNNLRFPGQYFDAETGLHYNWNRYYDPEVGRYISADPIGIAGGINLYAYVQNNPINLVDPLGLASLVTDMAAGTTTFDPRPEDPYGVPFTIQTRNGVDHRALPGAQDAFSTSDVHVRHRPPSKSYGPDGAYIDTGDPRYRNIHGGGSCQNNDYGDPQAPRQGWCVTLGCTRGQNENVINLGAQIKDFQRRHQGTHIPYTRFYIPYAIN